MDSVCENIEITHKKALINFMNWAKKKWGYISRY